MSVFVIVVMNAFPLTPLPLDVPEIVYASSEIPIVLFPLIHSQFVVDCQFIVPLGVLILAFLTLISNIVFPLLIIP